MCRWRKCECFSTFSLMSTSQESMLSLKRSSVLPLLLLRLLLWSSCLFKKQMSNLTLVKRTKHPHFRVPVSLTAKEKKSNELNSQPSTQQRCGGLWLWTTVTSTPWCDRMTPQRQAHCFITERWGHSADEEERRKDKRMDKEQKKWKTWSKSTQMPVEREPKFLLRT